ncbi:MULTISPECIES: SDR family oxidoreductase [Rhizobium/Agrobacterium group]|jgi:serine 3-dehydrogenase|uniref:Serine 3-dehydrogenase n=3 Tax=Bacteria TaxID=2 RepID=A0A1L9CQ33_9HYPH|nr:MULTISPECIES: SDR family oxidoreductase [Rhizobium/Agrobacterium group]AMD57647.1 NAD(P)-dependent oxidoreductase [Agrobacterium tumefaciens]ANV26330.1 NADP-dependent 3-hydroxy acid dehydrogenase [Rhizobium sp. S41]KGE83251.1 malonic semialdehyde reductase [Rhizobium sp. H41]MBB2908078.1 serine 3-dehydrogenase [Rhizobium sp. RAS22]MBM7323409.1 SDR family oxidoreductase [Agrobacterium sp. S2]HAU74547.1 SDR family NAD(P)-dependent oxidoreductase [Agrobacterium sp.]
MSGTILITGATSGFGEATARRFIREGWKVIGTGRRAERLEALAAELGSAFYGAAFDITDEDAAEKALAALPEGFRDIDVLVNNAGLALGTAPAPQVPLKDWQTMVNTNITGLLNITHHLLPTLIDRKGIVVNLSSVAAHYPYTGGNVYGGTKAFLRQFSLGLRSDLHGKGVRVTSIEPGMCETEFTLVRTGGNQEASDNLYKGVNPITADDIANTIYWVASQPKHININSLELMPVNQSFAGFQVYRES